VFVPAKLLKAILRIQSTDDRRPSSLRWTNQEHEEMETASENRLMILDAEFLDKQLTLWQEVAKKSRSQYVLTPSARRLLLEVGMHPAVPPTGQLN
jgi:hypothetical protein